MKRNTDSIQPHELWEVKDYSEIMDINLKSRNRDRQTVWARYAVWLYLMEECGAKLADISRLFGWHHAAIIYGVEQIKEAPDQRQRKLASRPAHIGRTRTREIIKRGRTAQIIHHQYTERSHRSKNSH